ncbi:MAG: thioredoxin family protein [Anaerolineales bacterium]|nr:MAG: thioredoxin family protein [Anaerolineales bacterium]
MACLAAKPIVDGIERDHAGQLIVLRVDVQDPVGKIMAREQSVIATPTFILYNAQGEILWKSVGTINAKRIAEALR